jgi:cytochrome c553
MSGIAASLSDAEAADAASYYALRAIRPDSVEDWSLASLGQRIFFAGAGAGMAPACAMCHGPTGRPGMPMMGSMMGSGGSANVPTLNGQHAAYIVDQLNGFASGARQSAMMMMNRIAAALSETDKKAVAEFLSSLP